MIVVRNYVVKFLDFDNLILINGNIQYTFNNC